MSHFTEMRTQLKDKDSLLAALEACGLKPEVHEQPVQMNGYYDEDEGSPCHIVISKAQLNTRADFGFAWSEPDGCYTVVADWFDIERRNPDLLKNLDGRISGKVMVEYARQSVLATAKRQNMTVDEKVIDGKLQITLKPARRAVATTSVRTTSKVQARR